ncbi:MAG: YrbL family protein [Pseudomonadota bacterium]
MDRARIVLSGKERLASGKVRSVYIHPDDPDKVLKVLHPNEEGATGMKGLMRRIAPFTRYRHLQRENEVSFRASIMAYEKGEPSPVVAQYGVAYTDLGLATICECVRLPGETLGRTLDAIARAGELPGHLDELNDFARRLFAWGIRANDLHPNNIVFGERDGLRQFVMIDGLGDSHVIPLRSMSDAFNARSLNKRMERSAKQIGATWNATDHRFALA